MNSNNGIRHHKSQHRRLQKQAPLFTLLIALTISTPTFSKQTNEAESSHCLQGNDNEYPNETCSKKNSDADNTNNINRWKWNPDQDVCNITRITRSNFKLAFGAGPGENGLFPSLYTEPIIVVPDDSIPPSEKRRRRSFQNLTARDVLTSRTFPPAFEITLTSSNAQSEHSRVSTLEEYVREQARVEILPDRSSGSNETWYLFGQTYGQEWHDLLMKDYVLPPCRSCGNGKVSLSFGIGGRGSGVQWHTHGPGFSESVHGRKHWVLYPGDRTVKDFNKDLSSRHWMEEVYTAIEEKDDRPWECTVHPGEMVYFPDRWHHATINLDPYTVFVSSFTWEWNDDDFMLN